MSKLLLLWHYDVLQGGVLMKNLYLSEVGKELAKYSNSEKGIITESDITSLPKPVQKYFHYCGYSGKEKMVNAQTEWKDVYFKMAPNKKWMKLECYQFNSVAEPIRIVYMKSKILGIFPFEGRDKYQDGHGNMLAKLLKFIKVVDAKSKEMDESALVTVLAEALIVPTYALQSYIKWDEIDSNTAKAVINYNNSKVCGLFYFKDNGEFIRFETHDRYYSENGKEYKKVKWAAVVDNYTEKNGIKIPSVMKGIWHTDEGHYEYFRGTINNISFNISEINIIR